MTNSLIKTLKRRLSTDGENQNFDEEALDIICQVVSMMGQYSNDQWYVVLDLVGFDSNKIRSIKKLRHVAGLSLKDAKDLVDLATAHQSPVVFRGSLSAANEFVRQYDSCDGDSGYVCKVVQYQPEK